MEVVGVAAGVHEFVKLGTDFGSCDLRIFATEHCAKKSWPYHVTFVYVGHNHVTFVYVACDLRALRSLILTALHRDGVTSARAPAAHLGISASAVPPFGGASVGECQRSSSLREITSESR
jgi:hypothetical protein